MTVAYDAQASRDWAAAMLRRHRIAYVVLNDQPNQPYWKESRAIASNPARWGLRKIFADRSAMLFEVVPAPQDTGSEEGLSSRSAD